MSEPTNFRQKLNTLAEKTGLALVLVNEKEVVSETHNNSVCRTFLSSPKFAGACAEFCGRAFERANAVNKEINYRCHAGLKCLAMPFEDKKTVAIVGRAFLSIGDYKDLTERLRNGDLRELDGESCLENVLWADSPADLERTASKFLDLKEDFLSVQTKNTIEQTESGKEVEPKVEIPELEIAEVVQLKSEITEVTPPIVENKQENLSPIETQTEIKPEIGKKEEVLPIAESATEIPQAYSGKVQDLTETVSPVQVKEQIQAENKPPVETLKEPENLTATKIENKVAPQSIVNKTPFADSLEKTAQPKAEKTKPQPIPQTKDEPFRTEGKSLTEIIKLWREKQDAERKNSILNDLPTVIIKKSNGETTEMQGGKPVNSENIRTEIIEKVIHPVSQPEEKKPEIKIPPPETQISENRSKQQIKAELAEISSETGNLIGAVFQHNFKDACIEAMLFLKVEHNLSALAWLERRDKKLETIATLGTFKTPQMQIGLEVTDSRLLKVIEQETSLRLQARLSKNTEAETQFIELFPLAVGNEIKGALVVGEKLGDETKRRELSRFCRQIAVPFEVLRLRQELKNRAEQTEKLKIEAKEYELASITDDLTGLLNKRYIKERLEEEVKRSARHEYPMCFMMLDVDNFKKFNDDFGHPVGDQILRETAKNLKSALRGADVAARYGGEEFCILLPQTTIREATAVAERIRRKVENTNFPQRQVTISIGVVGFSEKYATSETLIKAADDALYQAKANGRNNVQLAK